MKLKINSFKNYIKNNDTLLKILDINNHKLESKVVSIKDNKSQIDFGHFTGFKITTKELVRCFKYNRRLSILKNNYNIVNKKLNFTFKEFSPSGDPLLSNPISKNKIKKFDNKLKSLKYLRKALVYKKLINGRIIKKVKGGFIVSLLGIFAFLPKSHSIINYGKKKRLKRPNIKITRFFFNTLPLQILGIKCFKRYNKNKRSVNYVLNLVVSFKKAFRVIQKYNKKTSIKKLVRIKNFGIWKKSL